MKKRIFALLLTALMLLPCLASCGSLTGNGAYITVYLTDEIYDFDPANAYRNAETAQVVSWLFEPLFELDENGKVKPLLAKKYVITENEKDDEYVMEITLNETSWSNGTALTANDVVFAWKRLLNSNNSFEAASLLYDIKNARAVKNGDVSIDDIGVSAESDTLVKIIFEGKIDYNQFLINLTSVATAPLLENYVTKNADWAKKSSTIVTSGPFKLSKMKFNASETTVKDGYALTSKEDTKSETYTGQSTYIQTVAYFTLDRNVYYFRDKDKDDIDKSVTPCKILCTFVNPDEEDNKVYYAKEESEMLSEFKDGKCYYIGDIPLSLRSDSYVQKNVKTENSLSTFVCYFNQNAMISKKNSDEGEALFANASVRKALSLAIDREALASAIVYAQAATGFVCPGVFNETRKGKDFRTVGGNLISTSADLASAKKLLSDAKITASDYTFSLTVASNDEEQLLMATEIVKAWCELGFNVTLKEAYSIQNNDYNNETASVPVDICDDQLTDYYTHGDFEVIAFDYVAYSADAYSMLANFATAFSGMAIDIEDTTAGFQANRSGYNSERYNAIMEAVYYVPYFANLSRNDSSFLGIYETEEDYQKTYDAVKAIYDEFGITPTTKSGSWQAQKTTLLHEAEKVLLEDMAIIPVVFNQYGYLISKSLSKVTSTYYNPTDFTKCQLKNYEDYYIYDENKKKYTTIFDNFPVIDWDKASK